MDIHSKPVKQHSLEIVAIGRISNSPWRIPSANIERRILEKPT